MCGIIAVVSRPASPADPAQVLDLLAGAVASIGTDAAPVDRLLEASALVASASGLLEGPSGCNTLLGIVEEVRAHHEKLQASLTQIEGDIASGMIAATEPLNDALTKARDAFWSLKEDRLRTAYAVADLIAEPTLVNTVHSAWAIQTALSGLDRLEVRGRDSAGIAIVVEGDSVTQPSGDALLETGSVLRGRNAVAFVYKTAQEVGELGRNSRVLREQITSDRDLLTAISNPRSTVTVLAHTRWASIGLVTEPNAHPLHSGFNPEVLAVLNGDIDNHGEFRGALEIPPRITTDAKIIPAMISKRLQQGAEFSEAYVESVALMEGSTAIAAVALDQPDRVACSLKGSGQGMYIGRCTGALIVASEPYALVEQCRDFIRLEGAIDMGRGQAAIVGDDVDVFDIATRRTQTLDWQVAEITTRDIDLGGSPHFLLKELAQSPDSVESTIRGRITAEGVVDLGPQALSDRVIEAIENGSIKRLVVIGQGTAAIAASGVARLIRYLCEPWDIRVESMPATEFSGFETSPSLADTLVVAISQSGTTADTNRTVEIAKSRKATVLAIVNRRNSDLVSRADGVIYTSDGRDVEMAVPSTKAFYCQIAAGALLASRLASIANRDPARNTELLKALALLPQALRQTLELRGRIKEIASETAPKRRHWAVVGSGPNVTAAQEIRIKISELCYASIACDFIEDKKHIDLSAEPLILECVAGLKGSIAHDVAREIAYHQAHRAAPIVIATEGFVDTGAPTIWVPNLHPQLDYIAATMVGHIFGYEAALAIDELANRFRALLALVAFAVENTEDADDAFELLNRSLRAPAAEVQRFLADGLADGPLKASVALRVLSLLRYSTRASSLDAFEVEWGELGTPAVVIERLLEALNLCINELTRPIDAIKHQAKTVTVGISRTEEGFASAPLVAAALDCGVELSSIGYQNLRSLEALSKAILRVTGHTRYRIEGDVAEEALAFVVSKSGVAENIVSRIKDRPILRGAKRRVAIERDAVIAQGAADGRTVVIIPETSRGEVRGICLLHVDVVDALSRVDATAVLEGYRGRLAQLRDLVLETESSFDTSVLEAIDPTDLLVLPLWDVAKRFRT